MTTIADRVLMLAARTAREWRQTYPAGIAARVSPRHRVYITGSRHAAIGFPDGSWLELCPAAWLAWSGDGRVTAKWEHSRSLRGAA